jgi:hypothetical protein
VTQSKLPFDVEHMLAGEINNMADMTPPSPPPPPPPAKRRKTIFQRVVDNKKVEKEKLKSRVLIGAAFERWRQLKDEKGLKTDACVAVDLVSKLIPFILGNTGVETSVLLHTAATLVKTRTYNTII